MNHVASPGGVKPLKAEVSWQNQSRFAHGGLRKIVGGLQRWGAKWMRARQQLQRVLFAYWWRELERGRSERGEGRRSSKKEKPLNVCVQRLENWR